MIKHITLIIFFKRVLNASDDLNAIFMFSNLTIIIMIQFL